MKIQDVLARVDELKPNKFSEEQKVRWLSNLELIAYEQFICRICDMARNQKRINAKEKEVDNEKYAFRCFLLRLGFIGDEHKVTRKILLRNLSGSSAFKAGSAKEVAE